MNPDRQDITVSVQDLVGFVLRGALLAVVVAGVAGLATYLLTARQAPVFRAEATLLVARSNAGAAQFGISTVTAPPIDLAAYRVAVASDQVLADGLRRLGVESPTVTEVRHLRGRIGSSTEAGARDSSLLRVEGRGGTPGEAVARANAVAEALVAWDRRRASEGVERVIATLTLQVEALSEQVRSLQAMGDENLQSQVDGLVRLRAEQQQQLAYARALVASAEGLLSVLQPADSTVRQSAPRPLMNAAVVALLAIAAVYGLLLLRVALNTRLRGAEDIARVSGLPVLAEFPTAGRNDAARLREASNYLRTNLVFATEDAHPRVLMVTSSVEHEGKTTVARAIAEGFVRYGYRTLLVDADLRSPSVVDAYDVAGNVPDTATTESWLTAPDGPHHVLNVDFGEEQRLDVIPQYRPIERAAEVLGRGFRLALARWQRYDVVVVDTPPVLAVADPLTVAPHCTGTVLVVDRNRSDRRKLASVVGALGRVGVDVLGIVVNHAGGAGSTGYGAPYGEAAPARRKAGKPLAASRRMDDASEAGGPRA